MTKQEYIKHVAKYLQCSPAKKQEITKQLDSDIEIALGEGKPLDEILTELGEPKALAGEFNENLEDSGKKRVNRRSRIVIILGIFLTVTAVAAGWLYWRIPKQSDIYKSKIFDAEEVQSLSEELILLFSEGDYDTFDKYLSEEMRPAFEQVPKETVKSYIGDDWGEMRNMGNSYMAEVREKGKSYAIIQMNVSYENVSVTFTLSFKDNMTLYGFYVK